MFFRHRSPNCARWVFSGRGSLIGASGKTSEQHSAALADTISWQDGLVQLTLGVCKQYVDSKSYSGTTGLKTRAYSDTAVTPTFGLVIRPTQALSLYANYIEGLTPGPTPPAAAVNAGDVFAPFKSKQYEAGAKLDFGTLGFGLSLFQIDVPSGITDPIAHVYKLDGLQRNRGVEFTTFGELTSQVRLLGGATFFDARQYKTSVTAITASSPLGSRGCSRRWGWSGMHRSSKV